MVSVRELLGPEGPLGSGMRGYEHRSGQLAMADAVVAALAGERILLCEAGTGTGKTLAYLVPAVQSGRHVVVSTATKALQDQIFHKDLPLLERHLGLRARSVLCKGLGNYVCRRRLAELRARVGAQLPLRRRPKRSGAGSLTDALALVERWLRTTESGDIAELTALPEGHPIFAEITSSSETRLGPRCSYHEECFVTRLRRAAEQADLLVVNHHLLFADLALRAGHPAGVLPRYDAAILDEAHRIEDIATSFFGVQVSSAAIERLLGDAERALEPRPRLLDALRRSASW